MTTTNFGSALPFVLRWEGGLVDHPADPGGRTNRGITQRVYDVWRGAQSQPVRDVGLLEDAEMRAIYETGYWLPARSDLLADGLDLVQFDTAVNMGVRRAVRLLQLAVACAVDGSFGPATREAAQTCDVASTLVKYCDAREKFYRALVEKDAKLGVFLKGWVNRLDALRGQVGLPGQEALLSVDFGDAGFIAKIPDELPDPVN